MSTGKKTTKNTADRLNVAPSNNKTSINKVKLPKV